MRPSGVPDQIWGLAQLICERRELDDPAMLFTPRTAKGRGRTVEECRYLSARWEVVALCRAIRKLDGRPKYTVTGLAAVFRRDHTTIIYGLKRWPMPKVPWPEVNAIKRVA